MDFSELIGLLILLFFLFFPILRQIFKEKKAQKKKPAPAEKKLSTYTIEGEGRISKRSHLKPIPDLPPIPEEIVQEEEKKASKEISWFDKKFGFEPGMSSRHLDVGMDQRHLESDITTREFEDLLSNRFTADYTEISQEGGAFLGPSRVLRIVRKQKTLKDVIILYEILNRPYK